MIVITSPLGHIGHQVLDNLIGTPEELRVVVQDPSDLPAKVRDRVEVIEGSHGDPALTLQSEMSRSQPFRTRVSAGITTQVRTGTISPLRSRVRSGSGHEVVAGPTRARMAVITGYTPAHVTRATLYLGGTLVLPRVWSSGIDTHSFLSAVDPTAGDLGERPPCRSNERRS